MSEHDSKPQPSPEAEPDMGSESSPASQASTPSARTAWERDTLERLAFATLAEQRAARRWRIFSVSRGCS